MQCLATYAEWMTRLLRSSEWSSRKQKDQKGKEYLKLEAVGQRKPPPITRNSLLPLNRSAKNSVKIPTSGSRSTSAAKSNDLLLERYSTLQKMSVKLVDNFSIILLTDKQRKSKTTTMSEVKRSAFSISQQFRCVKQNLPVKHSNTPPLVLTQSD